ncbi:transcriptional regulator [Rodentibacter trehalosifermentans]|uniref:Transcriptional regulator n=1 Tax=Rodentibacter trehalosifermentans TaxID=1908263 RepID=A0A1V3J3G3_9PAST|nr:helix-turn-helix transcriptional regulator [Rodentibacter trehalosifermentans]OOF44719.1 transcriptional regulator [Rodentibacter trehalosifermentans]OOF49521.1 transcriptional regulator [Rodentibacter trehalosifermentans]
MGINEKVRLFRELNHWSQEEMAERMNMSVTGYAKIERGETNLSLHKLKQIASVFQIDLIDLLSPSDNGVILIGGENNQNHFRNNYYGSQEAQFTIEKLELELKYKDELLAQKDHELENLKELMNLLKQSIGDL